MLTTDEIIRNTRDALDDLCELTQVYPKLKVLNITSEDSGQVDVLINQDTFDNFVEHLQDAYYTESPNRAHPYRSTGTYGILTLIAYSMYPPGGYPKVQEEGKLRENA